MTVEDPLILWNNLKNIFDYQNDIFLQQARHKWLNLRLQYYAIVSNYDSAMFRITSELILCSEKINDQDMF